MFISRKYIFCFALELCVCIFFVILIFFHHLNGVPKQFYRYEMTRQCVDRPESLLVFDREQSRSGSISFTEPVDLVLTWVNGSDPSLIENLKVFSRDGKSTSNRYRDWGTLRYCLRSVEKNANWIRHIYIVTNGQVPRWLNTKNPRVSIVKHSEIFANKSHLPTFNSLAIESNIHRIPGLSQQFLYMNDDFFFANTVEPTDFYTNETGFKLRFGVEKVPDCSEKCKLSDINNGICDNDCNSSRCDWDGDDCGGHHSRSELDGLRRFGSFFGAMTYTSYLYNKAFGYVHRRVPAHVPYVIDKTLMSELQNRFPEEWQRTSASRFRDPYNFLYAFAYYHYLMRPQRYMRGKDKIQPVATTFQNYADYTYFPTGNSTRLEKLLNGFVHQQRKRKKFACINDHMFYRDATKEAQCQVVMDTFFKRLFPNPSSFELEGMD